VLGAKPVEVVVLLPGPPLHLLSSADKAREKLGQGKHERGRDESGRNSNI
jgi:hypothetical protein